MQTMVAMVFPRLCGLRKHESRRERGGRDRHQLELHYA
jgi:hypothetical protein